MREMLQYSVNIRKTATCIVLHYCTSQQNTFGRQVIFSDLDYSTLELQQR